MQFSLFTNQKLEYYTYSGKYCYSKLTLKSLNDKLAVVVLLYC